MKSGFPMNERRLNILRAAAARILPSDDGPDATEAGVVHYMERVSRKPAFEPLRRQFVEGIDLLHSMALDLYDKDFVRCEPWEQDGVLKAMQNIPHRIVQQFFSMLVNITIAGFLCDPTYGGNRDAVGWRYIGFEPRPPKTDSGGRVRKSP